MENWYEILEVSEKASSEVIEKAYKVLAKKYHPDLQQNTKEKKQAEEKMKQINEAYEILSNGEKRKEFDNKLLVQRQIEEQEKTQKQVFSSPASSERSQTENKVEPVYENPVVRYTVRPETKEEAKQRRKQQEKAKREYRKEYNKQVRKAKWVQKLKKIRDLAILVLVILVVCFALWNIPTTHNLLVSLYENNKIIRLIVDIFLSLFHLK